MAAAVSLVSLAGGQISARAQTQRGPVSIDCASVHRLEIEQYYTTTGLTGKNPRAEYFVVVRNPDGNNGVLFSVTFNAPDLNRQAQDDTYLLRPGQSQRVLLGSRLSKTTVPLPELTPRQIADHTQLMCQ